VILGDVADLPQRCRAVRAHRLAEDLDLPLGRLLQSDDQLQERTLARAVRPHQPDDGPARGMVSVQSRSPQTLP
jgi:hypothetical protein